MSVWTLSVWDPLKKKSRKVDKKGSWQSTSHASSRDERRADHLTPTGPTGERPPHWNCLLSTVVIAVELGLVTPVIVITVAKPSPLGPIFEL